MMKVGKKIKVTVSLKEKTINLLKAAGLRASARKSLSKMIDWSVEKALADEAKSIKEKIAEHQAKADNWKKILKDYEEVRNLD